MKSAAINDPKDEHILNKDDSITNKDGDNYLEKGDRPFDQNKPDKQQPPSITPGNDNGEPEPSAEEKQTKKNMEAKK